MDGGNVKSHSGYVSNVSQYGGKTMLKSYEVWYWGYDPDNLGQTQMLRKDVLVSDAMLKRCMSRTKYDYLSLIHI